MTKQVPSSRLTGVFTEGARLGMGHAAIDPAISAGSLASGHTMVSANGDKANAVDAAAAIEFITERVLEGDLSDLEAILVGQAVSLNAMSMEMLSRARNIGTADAVNTLAAVGLRAAAQSRAAIDSLVNLKNPRQVAFVKQANINNGGQQQINNTRASEAPRSHAHEEALAHDELLLETDASPILEPRATRRPGRGNKAMETVGVVHRTTNSKGQGRVRT